MSEERGERGRETLEGEREKLRDRSKGKKLERKRREK